MATSAHSSSSSSGSEGKRMSVTEALEKRISTRKFLASPSPSLSEVSRILSTASRAPSGGNTQPWHVYVIYGEDKEKIFKAVFQSLEQGDIGNQAEFQIYPPSKARFVPFSFIRISSHLFSSFLFFFFFFFFFFFSFLFFFLFFFSLKQNSFFFFFFLFFWNLIFVLQNNFLS